MDASELGLLNLCPKLHTVFIPQICQFWYTTALFRPVKVHHKVRKFETK